MGRILYLIRAFLSRIATISIIYMTLFNAQLYRYLKRFSNFLETTSVQKNRSRWIFTYQLSKGREKGILANICPSSTRGLRSFCLSLLPLQKAFLTFSDIIQFKRRLLEF